MDDIIQPVPSSEGPTDYSEAMQNARVYRNSRETKVKLNPPKSVIRKDWPPDYDRVLVWRRQQIEQYELNPELVEKAKKYYRTRPAKFIMHWCDTWDTRNAGTGKSVRMPFILFPKQVELVKFIMSCLKDEEGGLIEKSRDMGATWVCVAMSVWLWLFWPGIAIGWGSQKQEQVDRLGDPSSIFEKIRLLITHIPKQFLPHNFNEDEHLFFMRCINPETGASITGEIGDSIGRGGRTRITFKDESAHYEHPEKIESSLSDTTRCPIDISSVNGPGNVFAVKRENGLDWHPGCKTEKGRTRVFVMDWRDHPQKDKAWYEARRADYQRRGLMHILAQEVDRNYTAALAGLIIQHDWVKAAFDAHKVLKIPENGMWCAGLDVADEGGDTNAFARRKGIVLRHCSEWGERDVGVTARNAIAACQDFCPLELQYDSIGMGATVKAEANRLADEKLLPKGLQLVPWNAGAQVLKPGERVIPDDRQSPLNKDFYQNLKAQAWWELGQRFFRTWQMVTQGVKHDFDDLISIDTSIPLLHKIEKELCQATASRSSKMKLLVDKSPDGTKSPNLADAIVMAYWPLPLYTFTVGMGPVIFRDGERIN